MGHTLSPEGPTWMRAIREAGYRTSVFGKTHLHRHQGNSREREHSMHTYGLDDVDEIGGPRSSASCLLHMTAGWRDKGPWEAYQANLKDRGLEARPSILLLQDYADVYVGQQAKRYLAAYEWEEPWFCWVSFGGPHDLWDPPESYAGCYRPEDMPTPTAAEDDGRERPKAYLDERMANGPALASEAFKRLRANYAGNVTLIDDQIGEILSVIEERSELDRTAFVFVFDQGEMNGDYGLVYKSNFRNRAVRRSLCARRRPSGGARAERFSAGRSNGLTWGRHWLRWLTGSYRTRNSRARCVRSCRIQSARSARRRFPNTSGR